MDYNISEMERRLKELELFRQYEEAQRKRDIARDFYQRSCPHCGRCPHCQRPPDWLNSIPR